MKEGKESIGRKRKESRREMEEGGREERNVGTEGRKEGRKPKDPETAV